MNPVGVTYYFVAGEAALNTNNSRECRQWFYRIFLSFSIKTKNSHKGSKTLRKAIIQAPEAEGLALTVALYTSIEMNAHISQAAKRRNISAMGKAHRNECT